MATFINSFLIDINITFMCRSTHKYKNGENPIVLRIIYRGERRDIFTGLTCPKDDWLPELHKVNVTNRLSATINKHLSAIHHKAEECFEELKFSGRDFAIDELVAKVKGNEDIPQTLMEFLEIKVNEFRERVGMDLSIVTFYKYQRVKRYMENFLQLKKKVRNIPVSRIDAEFLRQFFIYLRKDKNNGHNSAMTLLNCLKTALHSPIKKGVINGNPFEELGLKQKPVYRDFLTIEEIEKLKNLKCTNDGQEKNRDLFLFACFTGLAYIDIYYLKSNNIIIDPDGSKHIQRNRQKTGVLSIIPILPIAEGILKKYSLTGNCIDFKWFVPSNQKLNSSLKAIGQNAGIEKTLHMHLARHTFATTITLTNGVPIETVSKMLGHTTIKHTQHYAKIVASKVKEDMLKISRMFT